jgi:hypothetical protein
MSYTAGMCASSFLHAHWCQVQRHTPLRLSTNSGTHQLGNVDSVMCLRRLLLTPLAAASLGMCTGCEFSDDHKQEIASLGVPLVTVQLTMDRLTLNEDAVTRIGGHRENAAGHAFHRVRDALLYDDLIIVGSSVPMAVRVFDLDGKLVGEIGRDGEGPGEFRVLASLFRWSTDSVVVWDPGLRRLTIFHKAGGFGRMIQSEAVAARSPLNPWRVVMLSGGAYLVVYRDGRSNRHQGFSRDSVFVRVFDAAGRATADIGRVAGDEWYRGKGSIVAPFSYRFRSASVGDLYYIGDGRSPYLDEYERNGKIRRRLRLPIDRRAITESEWRAARDRFAATGHPESRPQLKALMNAARVDSFPAFTALEGGGAFLWIQLYSAPYEPQDWLLVDPQLGTAVTLQLPQGVSFLDARNERVVLLAKDEFEREEVQVYQIARH